MSLAWLFQHINLKSPKYIGLFYFIPFQYLYKMFDRKPGTNCVTFYKMVDASIAHCYKLQQKDSVFEWVGM